MLNAQPLINRITHKEIQIIYGLSKSGARGRLSTIRCSLNKEKSHFLTIMDFCKAEDITMEDFDILIKRAYQKVS